MFSTRALAELEVRRQLLIATADAQRMLFQGHLQELANALGWVDRAAAGLRRFRSLLWIVAPAAGYLAVRRAGTLLRVAPLLLPWWRVARRLVRRMLLS